MKIKSQLEELLIERNRSIEKLQLSVNNECFGMTKKQYAPVFQLMEEIIKKEKTNNKTLLSLIEKIEEIEDILGELKYE